MQIPYMLAPLLFRVDGGFSIFHPCRLADETPGSSEPLSVFKSLMLNPCQTTVAIHI